MIIEQWNGLVKYFHNKLINNIIDNSKFRVKPGSFFSKVGLLLGKGQPVALAVVLLHDLGGPRREVTQIALQRLRQMDGFRVL